MLNREQILEKASCVRHPMPVPEWGGDVWLRALSVAEKSELNSRMRHLVKDVPRDEEGKIVESKIDRDLSQQVAFDFLAISLIDDSGQQMFTAIELKSMAAKQENVLLRLANEMFGINSFHPKEVEEDAKNSEASESVS